MYKSFFYQTLTFLIIECIIIRLIFFTREPIILNTELPLNYIISFHIAIAVCFIEIWIIYKIAKRKQTTNFIILYIQKQVNDIYYKSLQEIGHSLLTFKIVSNFIYVMGYSYTVVIKNYYSCFVFIVFNLLVFRFGLAYALFTDVWVLNKFSCFYNLIWVMICPLIFITFIGLLRLDCTSKKFHLEKIYFNVKYVDGQPYLTLKKLCTSTESKTALNHWVYFDNALDLCLTIDKVKQDPKFLFIRSFIVYLFLFCWVYVVINVYYF